MNVPGINLRQNLGLGKIVVASKLAVLYAESITPERDIADDRVIGYVIDVDIKATRRRDGQEPTLVWALAWDVCALDFV